MLAYLFAAALAPETPTEESTKAIESAGSILKTISALEEMAPVSGGGGYRSRTRDAEVREKQERLRQSVKELATQIHKSSPTDLGRLIPALPVMELLGMELRRDLAELEARQKREAEERAQREREQREAQERADLERKAAKKRADEQRRERERQELEARKLRIAGLQQRALSLRTKVEGVKESVTALQGQLGEARRQAESMQGKIKSLETLLVQVAGIPLEQLETQGMKLPRWQGHSPEPQDRKDRGQLVEQVGHVVLDARQDATKIQHEVGEVSFTAFDALSPARLEKVRDGARRFTAVAGRESQQQLDKVEREIQEIERTITSAAHHQRSLTNLSEQIGSVNRRVDAASEKPRESLAKQRRSDIWRLAGAVPVGAFLGAIAGMFAGIILAGLILWATGTNANSPEWNQIWFGVLWPTVIACVIVGAWRPIYDFQKNATKAPRG